MASMFYKFSPLVSVKEFKEKITSSISDEDIRLQRKAMERDKILSETEITSETLAELEDVCSPMNLESDIDEHMHDMDDESKATLFSQEDFASLRMIAKKGTKKSDLKAKIFNAGQKNYLVLSEELGNVQAGSESAERITGPEVVLSVALYHPIKITKVQEFLVTGKQTLSELRDKIYCPSDSIVVGEHSENPEFTTLTTAKDICPSGFIFIEGVFYNDRRHELSRDYSKVIMDWTNRKHGGQLPRYGVCNSKRMEVTRFEDLAIKLGYPYVYVHQGNCEHLLIFRDLRMLHMDDPQIISGYPFRVFRTRPKRQRCMICSIYVAKWVTRNDLLMSEDPSLFCEKCFKSLHYKNNQKAYSFSAYQYIGDYYW